MGEEREKKGRDRRRKLVRDKERERERLRGWGAGSLSEWCSLPDENKEEKIPRDYWIIANQIQRFTMFTSRR